MSQKDGAREPDRGVDLPTGRSASATFHQILSSVVRENAEAFASLDFPDDPGVFRKRYPDLLGRLEALRAGSPERARIARDLVRASHGALIVRGEEGEVPLSEGLVRPAEPLPLELVPTAGSGRYAPAVEVGTEVHRGDALRAFAKGLVARHEASTEVAAAVDWLLDQGLDDAGELDLTGRRIAVLGAGAELAPTLQWLAAGADVLWIDLAPPPEHLAKDSTLSGRLFHVAGGADLLAQPTEIRATLEAFAEGGPIDIGLYGYAPGRGREWRLAASMNAIVAALPRAAVRTVTLLISPTSPAVRTPAENEGEQERLDASPGWQRALAALGLLGAAGGALQLGPAATSRSIVSIQGASYQAAQYLEKWITAEAWATEETPLHVSANVAGITRTRSLDHPVFVAAFAGANAFGVETYAPETTRSLMGLLAARDWLDPDAPGAPSAPDRPLDSAARVEALSAVRVHGGLYVLPAPLDPALRVAAAIGMVRNPKLIARLIGG
jgi:hypothetical protein